MGKVFTIISQSQAEMSWGQAKLFCKCKGAAWGRFGSKLAAERTARAAASVAIKATAIATTDINLNFRHVTIGHLVWSRWSVCGARELRSIGLTCLKKYFRQA